MRDFHAGAENKASKSKYKTLQRDSSSTRDELYAPKESRSHQLRRQLDPRGHLLDVLGNFHAPRDKFLTEWAQRERAPIVKADSLHNERETPAMVAPDPVVGVHGIPDANSLGVIDHGLGDVLSRASSKHDNVAAPPPGETFSRVLRLTSELNRCPSVKEESPPSVGSPGATPPDDTLSDAPPPSTMPRKRADRARNPDPAARPASLPSSSERIRIRWMPRSFTSELSNERALGEEDGTLPISRTVSLGPAPSHARSPLPRLERSLPSPPNAAAVETRAAAALERHSARVLSFERMTSRGALEEPFDHSGGHKAPISFLRASSSPAPRADSSRETATRLLPARLARIVAETQS